MVSLNKPLLAVIAVLVLAVAGLGAYTQRLVKQVAVQTEAAEKAQKDLKAVQATLTLRNQQKAVSDRKAASASKALQKALEARKEWAATTTPPEVQDALCSVLHCTDGIPDGVRSK